MFWNFAFSYEIVFTLSLRSHDLSPNVDQIDKHVKINVEYETQLQQHGVKFQSMNIFWTLPLIVRLFSHIVT